MENVKELIERIQKENNRVAASQKDEIAVMKAMLNDKDFYVTVYDKNGPTENVICPSNCAREISSNVLVSTTKISRAEANALMDDYEYTKSDAENMINISKQFIHSYMETGRKLPLGGRQDSNIAISKKVVPETIKGTPVNIGTDEEGNNIWSTKTTIRPMHTSMKVYSTCPSWLK